MRENGSDSTLPRPTCCSLILQFATHATTTHTMRAVDYVTHGFGGPTLPIAGVLPPGVSLNAPIQVRVENAVAGYQVPLSAIKAAVITYNQLGPAGFKKTLAYVDAIEDAGGALIRMFPNMLAQLNGPMAGLIYKRGVNGILNAAASRIGLTPLSSEIAGTIRERLNRIPDSSTDPKSQFERMVPFYISSMRTWVGHLVDGIR